MAYADELVHLGQFAHLLGHDHRCTNTNEHHHLAVRKPDLQCYHKLRQQERLVVVLKERCDVKLSLCLRREHWRLITDS